MRISSRVISGNEYVMSSSPLHLCRFPSAPRRSSPPYLALRDVVLLLPPLALHFPPLALLSPLSLLSPLPRPSFLPPPRPLHGIQSARRRVYPLQTLGGEERKRWRRTEGVSDDCYPATRSLIIFNIHVMHLTTPSTPTSDRCLDPLRMAFHNYY